MNKKYIAYSASYHLLYFSGKINMSNTKIIEIQLEDNQNLSFPFEYANRYNLDIIIILLLSFRRQLAMFIMPAKKII